MATEYTDKPPVENKVYPSLSEALAAALDKLEAQPGFIEYMSSTGKRKSLEGIE